MQIPEKSPTTQDAKTDNETTLGRISERAPRMAYTAAALSMVVSVVTVFCYNFLLREPLWRFTMTFAKAFANMARSDALPPTNYYLGGVIAKACFVGFLLSMTWQVDNLLFEVFMVTAPVKNGLPLSASSKDPNGTLLNGLTRKSDLIKVFAFWEFLIISESHPSRRKDIFSDIERPNSAPMSTLMVNAGIEVINSIEGRVAELDPQPGALSAKQTPDPANNNIQRLPRLLPNAVATKDSIMVANNPTSSNSGLDRMGSYISHEARILGSSSNPWSPPLQKGKQLAIEYSSPAAHELRSRAEFVQQSAVGRYLLTTPVQLIESIVLGTPTGNATLYLHAIRSVTNLLALSLNEDTYGKAVASVPPTIQAITKAIFNIEQVVGKHTNGVVTEGDARRLEEVLAVHNCLKTCLNDLLEKFGSFLRDVGLSIRDLNEAHKAAENHQMFEILRAAPPQSGPAPRKKEMEEAIPKNRRTQSGPHDMNAEGSDKGRRRGEERGGKRRADAERPGRLFPQLDEGSAIDRAWREKRNSGSIRALAQ